MYAKATTTPSSVGLASNTYPQFLFICLGLCGVALVATAHFNKSEEKTQIKINLPSLLPVLLVLAIYVFVFDYVHFIASTIVFLAAEMLLFGERRWKVIVPVSVLSPVIIFFLFTKAFSIVLPA